MAAKRKRLEDEAESNPEAVHGPPSPIRREDLWLHIRQKPSGSYTSEQTRVVAEKIEDLKKKEAEGSFVSSGRSDVLTVATEKPDHGGRVRGVGGRVGLKVFFGSSAKRHRKEVVTREEMQ
ncbi:hypothetical protein QN277_011708 [Acacia crassicarpa]|uniref:Uncharacterized protein n=1 Tax=Acacia crassicarpa TaxID=499986 RepID=A0AAE1MZ93_9FABA|nr:hypothetical protein QN277_011708 [Acacia crassicarpa]